jgi:myo-inositol-1(or 4)-monophosphatase
MDYQKICDSVRNTALRAGDFIKGEMQKIKASDIETKSNASFVTYVDKTSEAMIVEELKKLIPEAGFVTEEGTAINKGEELIWYIDPLDGTTNYIHGLFPCSVSIGLSQNGEMVAGVVYELGQKELFYAWKGSKAFLNGKEIRVSETVHSADALIGTGFSYHDFEHTRNFLSAMGELMKGASGVRRMGSAAADLSYVAAGRFDAFFEHDLHAWDVAAGGFIVQQAGGKVTDFNGGNNWLFGGEMVAAGMKYFPQFYDIIHRYMGR